jgi:hypothetical protein
VMRTLPWRKPLGAPFGKRAPGESHGQCSPWVRQGFRKERRLKPASSSGAGLSRRTNVHEGSPAPFHGGGLQAPFPRGITAPGFRQGYVPHPAREGFKGRFLGGSLPLTFARGAFPERRAEGLPPGARSPKRVEGLSPGVRSPTDALGEARSVCLAAGRACGLGRAPQVELSTPPPRPLPSDCDAPSRGSGRGPLSPRRALAR